MTFINISYGFEVVWLQELYLLTDTPNYDIDICPSFDFHGFEKPQKVL